LGWPKPLLAWGRSTMVSISAIRRSTTFSRTDRKAGLPCSSMVVNSPALPFSGSSTGRR